MTEGRGSSRPPRSNSPSPRSPWIVREKLKVKANRIGNPPLPPTSVTRGGLHRGGGQKHHASHNDIDDFGDDDEFHDDRGTSVVRTAISGHAHTNQNRMRRRSMNIRPPLGTIRKHERRIFATNIAGMEKARKESSVRRSSVLGSISTFVDDDSAITMDSTVGGDSTAVTTDNVDDDDVSLTSLGTRRDSLGSVAPVRPQAVISNSQHSKINPSLNLSLDLSKHTRELFSDEDNGPTSATSASMASNEVWARFKLLGRLGLGEIEVSEVNKPLIERSVVILERALKHIVALRDDITKSQRLNLGEEDLDMYDLRTGHVLEEVKETISIPRRVSKFKRDPDTVTIDTVVWKQLRDYVTVISSMYRDNPFHNFEHASHVLNAVNKLISHVVTPGSVVVTDMRYGCGVATEPWTQFALVFSALIHDVDHYGVPNATLVKENAHVAGAYKNKSVAEQNSIELAWNLLMEPCYKELRDCLFANASELQRFRGLVVTAVMATDIADKELAAMRRGRAAEALNAPDTLEESDEELVSRKATFVLETLLQAADVSHTMGTFEDYKQWNRRLFNEMHLAYKRGRAEKDPLDSWYNGEFGFFDYYIIPLAKRLKDCGVKGKACEDYVKNATKNRREWELQGETIVEGYRREVGDKLQNTRKQSIPRLMADFDTDSSSSSSSESSFTSDNGVDHSAVTPTVRPALPRQLLGGSESIASEEKKEERIPLKANKLGFEKGKKIKKRADTKKKPAEQTKKATAVAARALDGRRVVKTKVDDAKPVVGGNDRKARKLQRSKSDPKKEKGDEKSKAIKGDAKIKRGKGDEKNKNHEKYVYDDEARAAKPTTVDKNGAPKMRLRREKSMPKSYPSTSESAKDAPNISEKDATRRSRDTTEETKMKRIRCKSLDTGSDHVRKLPPTSKKESKKGKKLKKPKKPEKTAQAQ